MSSRQVGKVGLLVPLILVLLVSVSASWRVEAQQEEARAEDQIQGVSLDELLAEDELTLSGEGYNYDPGDRRDPFKSLLVVSQDASERGPRPDGVPGLLIDEIELTGIFVTPEGPVAQVQATQSELSHLLHEGEQLYDGDVVSIGTDEVVFKQIVDDPTAVKPFREVVKKLNP